jgi:hypothetical protein
MLQVAKVAVCSEIIHDKLQPSWSNKQKTQIFRNSLIHEKLRRLPSIDSKTKY